MPAGKSWGRARRGHSVWTGAESERGWESGTGDGERPGGVRVERDMELLRPSRQRPSNGRPTPKPREAGPEAEGRAEEGGGHGAPLAPLPRVQSRRREAGEAASHLDLLEGRRRVRCDHWSRVVGAAVRAELQPECGKRGRAQGRGRRRGVERGGGLRCRRSLEEGSRKGVGSGERKGGKG